MDLTLYTGITPPRLIYLCNASKHVTICDRLQLRPLWPPRVIETSYLKR